MRTSAIIRIILGILLIVFLVGVLYQGINGGSNIFKFIPINLSTGIENQLNLSTGIGNQYANSDRYSVGEGKQRASEIKDLDINWTSGDVKVIVGDENYIEFYEESTKELNEDEKLRYYINNGKLTIQFAKSGVNLNLFNDVRKTLTVKVPKELTNLSIDVVSANINVNDLDAETVDIDNVSGDVRLTDISFSKLTVDTVSGAVNITGDVGLLDFDTVSGDLTMNGKVDDLDTNSTSGEVNVSLDACPSKVECDSVSGSVYMTIPEGEGFTANYDTVSGDFNCNFEVTSKKDKAIYKDGKNSFEFDTTSGDITIIRK